MAPLPSEPHVLASELRHWPANYTPGLGHGFGPGQVVPVVGFGCDARQQVCTVAEIGVYRGPRWLGELLVSLNGFFQVNGICIPQVEINKRRTNDQRHGSRKRNKTLNEKKCRNKTEANDSNGKKKKGGEGGGRKKRGKGGSKLKAEHIQPTTVSPQSMPEQQKTYRTPPPPSVLSIARDKLLICSGNYVFIRKTIGFQQKTRLEYDL